MLKIKFVRKRYFAIFPMNDTSIFLCEKRPLKQGCKFSLKKNAVRLSENEMAVENGRVNGVIRFLSGRG